MTAKKRVYDLAKEYGMPGQDLAAKLRDLGFTQVKSHMTALKDAELLEIRGRLEAYGIVGESSGESEQNVGGLKIRRRKKKKPSEEEDSTTPEAPELAAEPAADEEPSPAPAAASVEAAPQAPAEEPPVAKPKAKAAKKAAQEPADKPAPKESAPQAETPSEAPAAPAKPAAQAPAPADEVSAQEPQAKSTPAAPKDSAGTPSKAPTEAETSAPTEAAAEQAPEVAAPERAETTTVSAESTDTSAEEAATIDKAGPAATSPKKATDEADSDAIKPAAKRRAGKVVGFIDPSKFERKAAPKPQSRRLRSSDDVMPNVMPTMGSGKGTAPVRGDTVRGNMTAQELRERESGRFLRRRRPQQIQGRGAGRGRGRGRTGPSLGSPHAGSEMDIVAPITLKKLANALAVKENQVLRVALRQIGLGININSTIDEETALLLADEFEVTLNVLHEIEAEAQLLAELQEAREGVDEGILIKRFPTVAFLGHVDHGKTTLIDTIRKTRITKGEAGGITQHIGAYQVTTQQGHTLTVVDTPGHAAFSAMRARGASAVDIVVLVVASDDGVKPQTEEALAHAKAAGVPIVVAINKIDKPEANPERVRNELAALQLTPEEWGGDTAMLPVSALEGTGVEELLERVFLESEVLELNSHAKGPASGIILEAEIQQGKGKVAHLLVKDGSLKRGDVILAGKGYGKVRSIHDDRGKTINEAGPSMPVEVTGLNELPTIGDQFYVVESLDRASKVAGDRAHVDRQQELLERSPTQHKDILFAVAEADKSAINLIVKCDMQGSVEVIKQQIAALIHDEMHVNVLHAGVGAVLESDVTLAISSDARILAFHTPTAAKVRQHAEREGVEIKAYTVIYELLDDIKKLMEGELAPELKEEVTGHAEIRRIFKSSKLGNIAGCMVLDGKILRNSKVRLMRDGELIHTGSIGTLRREAEDTKQVREGFECGIVIKDFNDIKVDDVIEAYRTYEVKRTL